MTRFTEDSVNRRKELKPPFTDSRESGEPRGTAGPGC
jgi:hypothetical protein